MALSAEERKKAGQEVFQTGAGLETARDEWQGEIADAMIACDSVGGRPQEAGAAQQAYDENHQKRQLNLEAFFSPKECVRVLADAHANHLQWRKDNGKGDPEMVSVYANVRGVRSSGSAEVEAFPPGSGQKEQRQFTSVVVDEKLSMLTMNPADIKVINDALKAKGVPDKLLFDRNVDARSKGWTIDYALEMTIDNLRAAGDKREKGTFSESKGPIARIYNNDDPKAVDGQRESDVDKFINSHPNDKVCIDRWNTGYNALQAAGKAGTPLSALQKDSSLSADLQKVVNRAVATMFIADLAGIAQTREVTGADGAKNMKQTTGRIQFVVQRETQQGNASGLLPTYRKILAAPADKGPSINVGDDGKPKSEGRSRAAANTPVGFVSGATVRGVSAELETSSKRVRDNAKYSPASNKYSGRS